MTSLLFVDDDPKALHALEKSLRKQRCPWDMEFAPSGPDALSRLEHAQFDVVVSDLDMPEIDGVRVLGWVREHQPGTVRLMMRDPSLGVAAQRGLHVAHQFLAKPCDPAHLVTAVERIGVVLSRLTDERVLDAVGGLDHLPSPSASVIELGRLLEQEPVDIDRVAAVIAGDIAMSIKVLQLANSAFFGLPREITEPREAIAYVGLTALANTAMTAALFDSFESNPSVSRFAEQIQMIGSTRANLAFSIARLAGVKAAPARDIWLGSFLADVGAVALVSSDPERADGLLAAIDSAHDDHATTNELIRLVGAYILSAWGLPYHLVETVALADLSPEISRCPGAGYAWLANRLLNSGPVPVELTPAQLHELHLSSHLLETLQHG